jgi:hypothetical protein
VIAFVRSPLSVTFSRAEGADPTASATLAALTPRIFNQSRQEKHARDGRQRSGRLLPARALESGLKSRASTRSFSANWTSKKLLGFLVIDQATDRAVIRFCALLVVERDLPLRDRDDGFNIVHVTFPSRR